MNLFLSSFINKIDKKGRVSVPSSFRTVLTPQAGGGLVIVYQSFVNNCIEGCGADRIMQLSNNIDVLDPYSEERDAFATVILGGSMQLSFDPEGRVILPESLIDFAQLEDQACFVGKGPTFEIWNPQSFELHSAKARIMAKEKRSLLRLQTTDRGA